MDPIAQEQPQDAPTLLDLLLKEFHKAHLAGTPDRVQQVATLESFAQFCDEYLNKNRPVGLFHVDANYGLVLSNNIRCIVAPPMQFKQGDIDTGGAVPITGNPQGQYGIDHRQGGKAVDKTQSLPPEKLDHKGQYKREFLR